MMPSAIDKPFYVARPENRSIKKGDTIKYAPYLVKLRVLKVYRDTIVKRLLRRMGIKVRINQLKVERTKEKVKTIF